MHALEPVPGGEAVSEKPDKRVGHPEENERAIYEVVDLSQIVVLLLIKNHEAVMLFDEMIVSPKRREEEEHRTPRVGSQQPQIPGQHHRWSHKKQRQGSVQQPCALASLFGVGVRSRDGAEYVRTVEPERPDP